MDLIQAGEACIGCGLCAASCPIKIIEMSEDKRPSVSEANAGACLECGQCVAVCPKNTLTHQTIKSEKAPVASESSETVEAVIKNRRSTRAFLNQPVSTEAIQAIMDTVKYAPTGGNQQPVRWTVLRDKATIDRLIEATIEWMKEMIERDSDLLKKIPMSYFVAQYENGNQRLTYDAPCIVIAHADKDYWHAYLDCTIAVSYLEIVANANGFGTCWAGAMDLALKNSKELRDIIGIPEDEMNHNVLLLGKSKLKYPQVPVRKEAKINWK